MSEVSRAELTTTHESVTTKLSKDLLASDFLISIFWAALNSYRHDSILRPYPPMYTEDSSENKRTDELQGDFNSLPALDKILDKKATLNQKQTDLLQWILKPRGFTLQYRPPSTLPMEHILSQSSTLPSSLKTKPQYVFELIYNEENETKFQSMAGTHGVLYAFHGSSVENFHSIVHNGLLNMFNKVSAFGEGTYLSSQLSVCLNWSPSGALWPHSLLPHLASCVAVCEVVRHPTIMSRTAKRGSEPNLQNSVPEEYYIVSNDELVRVKYILLYRRERKRPQRYRWLYHNKFVIVIVVYVVVLLLVGIVRSNQFRGFYRKYIGHL